MGKYYQISPDGRKIIAAYDGLLDAAGETGYSSEHIFHATRTGKRYNGFFWRAEGISLFLSENAAEKRETLDRLQKFLEGDAASKLACRGLTAMEIRSMSRCYRYPWRKWELLKRQLDKISQESRETT